MQRQGEFAEGIAALVGRRVEYFRTAGRGDGRKKLSVQALADRCTELGLPLDRSVVAKLEKGLRQTITVGEVIVLAKALGVSPLELVLPVGYEREIEILPGQTVSTWDAARWFIGEEPFTITGEDGQPHVREDDLREWNRGIHPVVLYRHHEQLMTSWRQALEQLQRTRQAQDFPSTEMQLEAVSLHEHRVQAIERDLRGLRVRMEQAGLIVPDLPDEARHIDNIPGFL